MTQVLERPTQQIPEINRELLAPPTETRLRELGSMGLHAPENQSENTPNPAEETGAIEAIVSEDDAKPDLMWLKNEQPTMMLYTGHQPLNRLKMAPLGDDGAARHNLREEAKAVATMYGEHEGSLLLPPALTFGDANTIDSVLQNERVKNEMIEQYGEDVWNSALSKSEAITAVNAAKVHPADDAYRQFSRIRRGLPQDETIPPLDTGDLESFHSKPFVAVPNEPLIYNAAESNVVLDALRAGYEMPMAAGAKNNVSKGDTRDVTTIADTLVGEKVGDKLAVADVLSRYSPYPEEREKYDQILRDAGVDTSVGNLPHYDDMS